MTIAPFESVDELVDALRSQADVPSEDLIPALPHLLQTAELLVRTHPDDPELVAAGLVHDLASAIEPACSDHARDGARLVEPLLGSRVADLVAGHTDAKRYLITVDPTYAATLSPNSTHTLALQGGVMSGAERVAFEQRPGWTNLVELRRADDAAKIPGRAVRDVGAWRDLLQAVSVRSSGTRRP